MVSVQFFKLTNTTLIFFNPHFSIFFFFFEFKIATNIKN